MDKATQEATAQFLLYNHSTVTTLRTSVKESLQMHFKVVVRSLAWSVNFYQFYTNITNSVALEWQPIKFVCKFQICTSYNNITIKKSHSYSPMLKSPFMTFLSTLMSFCMQTHSTSVVTVMHAFV